MRILIRYGEKSLVELLQYNLETEGHVIELATSDKDVEDRLFRADAELPHLLIIGWVTLNGDSIDGPGVCRKIRDHRIHDSVLPILMLSARAEPNDCLEGLASGADDYVVKPFDLRELLLRIQNLLRRRAMNGRP